MKTKKDAEMRRLDRVSNANRPAGYDIPAQPQHTPTPWKSKGWNVEATTKDYCIAKTNPQGRCDREGIILPEDKANAAFIVTAVNAYEPTQKAIEKFLLAIGMVTGIEDARREFINAIAKAEGK